MVSVEIWEKVQELNPGGWGITNNKDWGVSNEVGEKPDRWDALPRA